MNAQTIDELDGFARRYIEGDVNRLAVCSLPLFDMWYVLTMASIYSCTKVGTISQKECVRFKFHVANEYKQFDTVMGFAENEHKTWVDNTKAYSGKLCEISLELAKKKPDVVAMFSNLFLCLDLLTKENVWLELFLRRIEDPDFMKSCTDAVIEHGDEWRQKFKNIRDEDYVVLLEKFYAATDENGMAQRFAALDSDRIKDNARRKIPVKDDDTRGISQSIREMYDNRRR